MGRWCLRNFTKKNLVKISNSIRSEQNKFKISIGGGDTVKSNKLSFSITSIGYASTIIYRNKVEKNEFDKIDNPLKNAPHTFLELTASEWSHKYSREQAAFPSEYLKENKYWAPVGRVDNVFGDRNLVCSCPSIEEYKDEAA